MRSLLDVNVLLALFDADHAFHERAHGWYGQNTAWASCPNSENGLIRIMSNPNYHPVERHSPSEVISALQSFSKNSDHEFWADSLSLRDASCVDAGKILGSRVLTDIYLLALACRNGGRLVTFDEGINLTAVVGAKPENLHVIR